MARRTGSVTTQLIRKYKQQNIKTEYGTSNRGHCVAYFINISGWLNVSDSCEDKEKAIRHFQQKAKHFIESKSIYLPYYQSSFVSIDMTDTIAIRTGFSNSSNKGYFSIELTILTSKKISFLTDVDPILIKNYTSYVQDYLVNLSADISISIKNPIKKDILLT